MGCNAWNHPANCNCGWGGVWHGNVPPKAGNSQVAVSNLHYILRGGESRFVSYVNPNAVCPICGASVFFYQSPNGGRVFFDDLGPPWPKHPCTDNPRVSDSKLLRPAIERGSRPNTPPWIAEGWQPFAFSRNAKGEFDLHHVEDWIILERRKKDNRKLRCITFEQGSDLETIRAMRFAFIRELPPSRGVYEVSMWTDFGEVRRVGYVNATLRETLTIYIKACSGDEESKLKLAKFLLSQKLFKAAFYWLDQLIEQAEPRAMTLKARCLNQGLGCEKDESAAQELMRRASIS